MPKKLNTLAAGSKVKYGKIYGEPIIWTVLEHGHSGYPSGTTTLLTEYIISLKGFDARESTNTDTNRASYGNNDWGVSNLRQWLNSSAGAGQWYSAQHTKDAPPTSGNLSSTTYPYDNLAGFLNSFTTQERNALVQTSISYGSRSGNSTSSTDRVFLLSATEVGLETNANDGVKFSKFANNSSRIAKFSTGCAANSSVTAGSAGWWWLRTSYASYSYYVRDVNTDGTLVYYSAYRDVGGLRPACNLNSNISVSDTTDSDGCYTLIYNTAPTTPPSITVPESIRATESFTVTWGVSTDVDGNLSGYILERRITTGSTVGSWSQVYKGSNRTYTDTLAAGTTKVQYRVKAYDSSNDNSSYTTSTERNVINNRLPVITGVDGPLGTFAMTPPTYSYTVTDEDADEVNVKTYIDNVLLTTETATLGEEAQIAPTAAQWVKILNGSHVFKIEATDARGGVSTKTIAFTKSVTSIEFALANPMDVDDKPQAIVLNVQGEFPEGSELTVEVCDNANDDEPTWEDVTKAILGNYKYFFKNETKTAETWAVGIRAKLDRGTATGDCFIKSIGGNFA